MRFQTITTIIAASSTALALPTTSSTGENVWTVPVFFNFWIEDTNPSVPFWTGAGNPCHIKHNNITGTYHPDLAQHIETNNGSASCLLEQSNGMTVDDQGTKAHYIPVSPNLYGCNGNVSSHANAQLSFASCVPSTTQFACSDEIRGTCGEPQQLDSRRESIASRGSLQQVEQYGMHYTAFSRWTSLDNFVSGTRLF
ncbi:MAG: hypothetical protein M1820_002227 [Bogoriella megaspora]|nr:MAG: hypothetical protein M1820_002227 [Bogoriella megaspora]